MLCSLRLESRTFTATVFTGFAKVLRRLSASTIDCAFLAFDFCCTVPCVFSISEIMLFTFRLLVVVSAGLLVPFVTLLSVHYHCMFLVFFSFLILTSK